MPFKVQVGPHQVAIHHGQTVLVSEPDGQINWPSEKGLYFFDTRVISSWTIYANGEPWELLNGGASPTTRREPISPIEGFPPPAASFPRARLALSLAD
jgi:N-terminal domain of (some) glycogen debranching enzymes